MDSGGAGQLQTADSSTVISDQISDSQCRTGSHSNAEFVNHGLIFWNETRQHWLGDRKPRKYNQRREPSISWNATYKSLLGTSKPFCQPIPLVEMIDFLLDIWEAEDIYD